MSLGANLSIMGLYDFDSTIFDLMEFPDGFTTDQKRNVIYNILVECAEFEFLYPAPEVAKMIIGIWSRKEKPYWNRVYSAAQLEYNPIENYRRNEEETINDGRTEEHSGTDSRTMTGQDSTSDNATTTATGSSTSTDTESGTDTTTNKIVGFDSNDLVNHDSSATVYGHKVTNNASGDNETNSFGSSVTEHNTRDNLLHGEKIVHDGSTARKTLAYGNIGVTTSQDMLISEMEVAKMIQLAPIIIESFKNRFCLVVY